jgi:predicted dehydrogenase
MGEVCHFLDALHFLADSAIVNVYASGQGAAASTLQSRDNVLVTLTHANGSHTSVAYVARSAPTFGKERLEAFGVGGIGVLDDYRHVELYGASGCRRHGRRQDKGHRKEVIAFVEAARAGSPPVALEAVANTSLASLAAVESMRTALPVRLEMRP